MITSRKTLFSREVINRKFRNSRRLSWLLFALFAVSLPGCPLHRFGIMRPFRKEPACVLAPGLTKTQVVDHLNQRIMRLYSWRSTDLHIRVSGMPMKLSALIAVESPRNFRLIAKSALGNEADLGSNPERFWFWVRRNKPKHVLTVSHEDMQHLPAGIQIPFHPDWLMEVLGVIPINGDEQTLQVPAEGNGLLSLVSERVSPNGQQVRKVMLVDSCHGYIVAHELYDTANHLIARAELNDYRVDKNHGIALPHRVALDWPQAKMEMTMYLGQVEVNPKGVSERTWKLPNFPGYARLDLGEQIRQARSQPNRNDERISRAHAENGFERPRQMPTPRRRPRLPFPRFRRTAEAIRNDPATEDFDPTAFD